MDRARLTRLMCQSLPAPEGSTQNPLSSMPISDHYAVSISDLARLHADIQEHGELEIGIRCGHPPVMARRASHWRLRELMRELSIHDVNDIPAP